MQSIKSVKLNNQRRSQALVDAVRARVASVPLIKDAARTAYYEAVARLEKLGIKDGQLHVPDKDLAVLSDPYWTTQYAINVLKRRWPEAESVIKRHAHCWDKYDRKLTAPVQPELPIGLSILPEKDASLEERHERAMLAIRYLTGLVIQLERQLATQVAPVVVKAAKSSSRQAGQNAIAKLNAIRKLLPEDFCPKYGVVDRCGRLSKAYQAMRRLSGKEFIKPNAKMYQVEEDKK